MPSKEMQKWSDVAMYEAEPIDADDGPQVQLLSCNNDPLGSIAAAAKAYKGEFVTSLAEITDEERRYYLEQMQKTALAMPLESVNFQFHISGVTRGFTHQMVRQRTAAYSQESTRFAVKSGVPVGLPPSIDGTIPWEDWVSKCRDKLPHTTSESVLEYATQQASDPQIMRQAWDIAIRVVEEQYNFLVDFGMPAEDARGLLPTNLLTQINYHTNLRNFIDEGGKRLCTQAQFEWRIVFSKMLEAMREYGSVQRYVTVGNEGFASSDWQFDAIANLFRPICYLKGKCVFKAGFDRHCSIRDRVDANAKYNVPSKEWNAEHSKNPFDVSIPAIHNEEWLLDSAAARVSE